MSDAPDVIGHDAQGRPLYDPDPFTPVYVGLDISLTGAGVAVLEDGKPPRIGVFGSRPSGPTLEDRARRMQTLSNQVMGFVMKEWGSEGNYRVAVEAPPYGKTPNQGSAWDRAYLWWRIVQQFISVNPITEISPTSAKLFGMGRGSAPAGRDSKAMMMAAASQQFPGVDFIDDNGCDALWLAAMAQSHYEPDTPVVEQFAYRVKALKAVAWG